MMRIEDFPRPKHDNGRGVHWSARIYHDQAEPSLDYWIDELTAMRIKWLKLMDDGGGSALNFCRKLLAADIMPVVRFYMPQLNPHRLGGRELDTVSRLVDVGVRYFESNNEPDLPAEWKDNYMPPDWLDVVINNFIRDADAVLARGGLLALPAMGPGSRDNPITMVVQKGRKDLFENGCWIAIHNYTLNHPLDYPDDDVNQLGRPLTQAEFDEYAAWAYSHLTYEQLQAQGIPITPSDYHKFQSWAWDGRNMDMVNELRATRKNPGQTVYDDPNCFRGYEAAGKMVFDALGFHVPVISTEGGPVVGWGDDRRYAKVNPTTQQAWQLGIVRTLQSQAPAWYFSCCTWLLASRPLGDFSPTWEQMSWYTHAWDLQFGLEGALPIVQALKNEPSIVRPELRAGNGVITGTARRQDGQAISGLQLQLTGESRDLTTQTDQAGAYRFEGLAAGTYAIAAGEVVVASGISLAADEARTLDLSLGAGHQSVIQGLVRDEQGQARRQALLALRQGQEQVAGTQTGNDGRYRFDQLAAGSYWVSTEGAGVAGIQVDGWNSQAVDLTVPAPAGLRYLVDSQRLLGKEETGNDRKFFGRVLDEAGNGLNGILVEMAWSNAAAGTQFPRQQTPRDAFKPAGNYEFLHSPGEFLLRVVQGDWPSDEATGLKTTGVPGREGDNITYEVNFRLAPVGGDTGTGTISGTIAGGSGLGLTLRRSDRSWATILGSDGRYAFDGLAAGTYVIDLEDAGTVGQVDLAQGAAVTFDYALGPQPQPDPGSLDGTLMTADGLPAAEKTVLVYRSDLLAGQTPTGQDGSFRFDGLQPGSYRVDVDGAGTLADGVQVRSGDTTTLSLVLPGPVSPPSTAEKALPAYLLFGSTRSARLLFEIALPYVRAHGLTAGFDLEAAKQAAEVTIVGGEDVISATGEQALREAGCQVQRLPGDPFALAEALQV
jgi:hypothetical protein